MANNKDKGLEVLFDFLFTKERKKKFLKEYFEILKNCKCKTNTFEKFWKKNKDKFT